MLDTQTMLTSALRMRAPSHLSTRTRPASQPDRRAPRSQNITVWFVQPPLRPSIRKPRQCDQQRHAVAPWHRRWPRRWPRRPSSKPISHRASSHRSCAFDDLVWDEFGTQTLLASDMTIESDEEDFSWLDQYGSNFMALPPASPDSLQDFAPPPAPALAPAPVDQST